MADKKIRTSLFALGIAAIMSLTACSQGIESVSLELPQTMECGTTAIATPEFSFSGETPEQAKVESLADDMGITYTSSNPNVIIVDRKGNLAAVNVGTAEVAIESKNGKIYDSGTIKVVISPTGISLPESITLSMESTPQASVDAEISPYNATDYTVIYSSADESVATVDENGIITAVSAGETEVTAQIKGTDLSMTTQVQVLPATEKEENIPQNQENVAEEQSAAQQEEESQPVFEQPETEQSATTTQQSTEYGAVPFSAAAGTGLWYDITVPDAVYDATLANINNYRAAVGAPPLSMDTNLCNIAISRCHDMIVAMNMSHDGHVTDEIIAQNWNSAQSVVDAWAASPGHYAAMTDSKYTICGIGCSFEENGGTYWCVTFQ